MDIQVMDRLDLLKLKPESVKDLLTPAEIVHISRALGAFWTYDYEAAAEGKVGMHALLKSGLHSDGFFVSRILLKPDNIRQLIARQMATRIKHELRRKGIAFPDYIVGIPDGATMLGEDIARIMNVERAEMKKEDGRIVLVTQFSPGDSLLFIEDFCTRGSGLTEAVTIVDQADPTVDILPYDPVIINRGGLKEVTIENLGDFHVLPLVDWRVKDWNPDDCPLCAKGSAVIKPKETDENWELITNSQR